MGRGSEVADFDGDGDISHVPERPFLCRNDSMPRRNWLAVEFARPGARVTVGTMVREVTSGQAISRRVRWWRISVWRIPRL